MSGFYLWSRDRLVWYSFDFVSSFYGCSDQDKIGFLLMGFWHTSGFEKKELQNISLRVES